MTTYWFDCFFVFFLPIKQSVLRGRAIQKGSNSKKRAIVFKIYSESGATVCCTCLKGVVLLHEHLPVRCPGPPPSHSMFPLIAPIEGEKKDSARPRQRTHALEDWAVSFQSWKECVAVAENGSISRGCCGK
jgi:hypothetical protein